MLFETYNSVVAVVELSSFLVLDLHLFSEDESGQSDQNQKSLFKFKSINNMFLIFDAIRYYYHELVHVDRERIWLIYEAEAASDLIPMNSRPFIPIFGPNHPRS